MRPDVGPRLPLWLLEAGKGTYVLEVPNEDMFIDGNWEHCPYSGPRSLATYANHSSRPNAKFEHWPLKLAKEHGESFEMRHRMWLVAIEPIPLGCELRVNYEAGALSSYWQGDLPAETQWRDVRVAPPLPPSHAKPVLHHLSRVLRGCTAMPLEDFCDGPSAVAWSGPAGGDARLAWLLPHLTSGCTESNAAPPVLPWALVATHIPGRTSLECASRGRVVAAELERNRPRLQKRKGLVVPPRALNLTRHGAPSSSNAPLRLAASSSSTPPAATGVAAAPAVVAPATGSLARGPTEGSYMDGCYKDAAKREQYFSSLAKLYPAPPPRFEEPPPELRSADPTHGHVHGQPVFAGHVRFLLTAPADCAVPPRTGLIKDDTNMSSLRLAHLIRAVGEGACRFESGPEDLDLLQGLHRLAQRVHGTHGKPRQLVHVHWQPSMPWLVPCCSQPVTVRLDVWLAEAIFTMRSDYDIWLMMSRLQPCRPILSRPPPPRRQPLPPTTPLAYRFSLAGLMRSMESAGYAEAEQPKALKLSLFPYQRQSLQWMLDRERMAGGLNMCFWQEHPLLPGPCKPHSQPNPTIDRASSNQRAA